MINDFFPRLIIWTSARCAVQGKKPALSEYIKNGKYFLTLSLYIIKRLILGKIDDIMNTLAFYFPIMSLDNTLKITYNKDLFPWLRIELICVIVTLEMCFLLLNTSMFKGI